MSAPPATDAVAAFLRSHQARARLFARWHGGDAWVAAQAWKDAHIRLLADLPAQPLGQWPQLLWRTLLDTPALKQADRAGAVAIPGLGRPARGPRAVMLLRLVAGLDDASAARVLGVAEATYREVLQRHLPRLHDGRLDEESWRLLQERVQAELRGEPTGLPPPRPAPRPLAPAWQDDQDDGMQEDPAQPWRWRNPLLATVALLTVAALAWTFFGSELLDPEPEVPPGAVAEASIRIDALPPAAAPAQPALPADAVLLTDPAFDLLSSGSDGTRLQDLAFDAWYAARLEDEREAERIAAEAMALDEAAVLQPLPEDGIPEETVHEEPR